MVTGLFTCVFMISVLNVIFKLVLLNLKKKRLEYHLLRYIETLHFSF